MGESDEQKPFQQTDLQNPSYSIISLLAQEGQLPVRVFLRSTREVRQEDRVHAQRIPYGPMPTLSSRA